MSLRPEARTPSFLAGEEGVRDAYASYGAELYRFALRGLDDPAAAQDVVQETFLRAWKAIERFDPQRGSVRGWLFAIARNVVIDQYRSRTARPWNQQLAAPETVEAVAAPTDTVDALMRGWVIEEALGRLGDVHRHAITETYLAGRTYDDVAQELGVSASTLRSRVFYGLKSLRVILDEMEVTW